MNHARNLCRSTFTICDILISESISRIESNDRKKRFFFVRLLHVEMFEVAIHIIIHLILMRK